MRWLCLVLLAGCGKLLGISELSGPDAGDGSTVDAAAVYRTLSGKVTKVTGGTPVGTVDAVSGGRTLAQTTIAGDGAYALQVPTDGAPFDVEVRIADTSATPTYDVHHVFYGPFAGDHAGIDVQLVTRADLLSLADLLGLPSTADLAQVLVEVRNAADAPVAGATVDALSAFPLIYYTADGVPTTSAATSDDGRAFLFNCKVGPTSVITNGTVVSTRSLSLAPNEIYEVIMRAP